MRLNGYQVKVDNTKRAWTGGVFDDFGNGWKWLFDLKDNAPGREASGCGISQDAGENGLKHNQNRAFNHSTCKPTVLADSRYRDAESIHSKKCPSTV